MKVLVTGAAGFLGSHLCDVLLKRGHEVRAMVHYNMGNIAHLRNQLEIVKGDIRFPDECLEVAHGVDAIVHLAACIHVDRSRRYPRLFYETNVEGTMNMLEASRVQDTKLVQMSSCEVIGNIPKGSANEEYPFKQPCSPYAASKQSAESWCFAYHSTYGLPINIIRGFNLCGPRQKRGKKGAVIPIFIERVLNELPPLIYGSGTQTRDYIDARDVAKGITSLLESDYRGELFHLCSGVEVSIADLTWKILAACGSNLKPRFIEARPGELLRSVGDHSKASRMLGWYPEISLEQSLANTVKYFRGIY